MTLLETRAGRTSLRSLCARLPNLFANDWPRIANYGVTVVAHAVLHPESRPRLVDVPLQVTADGRGGGRNFLGQLQRTHCTTKLKFIEDRKVVDWLGFRSCPETRFRLDPYRYLPMVRGPESAESARSCTRRQPGKTFTGRNGSREELGLRPARPTFQRKRPSWAGSQN